MKRRSPRPAMIPGLKGTTGAPVLAAATLAAAVLALSGCQAMSPIQTDVPYQPADGVAVDLGDVQIRDLVVVASAKGGAGILSGVVINKGSASITVTFATGGVGGSAQAEIPVGTATRLSGEGATPVTLPAIAVSPGDVVQLIVSTPTGGAPQVSVPVLLPTGYYESITPPPVPTTTSPPVPTTTSPPAPTTAPAPAATNTTPAPAPTTSP